MNEKESKNKTLDIFGGIFAVTMIIGIFAYQYNKDDDISKHKSETIGKIIGFESSGSSYSLKYEYFVNNKKYEGSVGTKFFKCKNGIKGCIGEKIKVIYSYKTPKYSHVYLGEYEKYKKTIYLKE
ncbi:hypothetical protein [Tenacibaculum sp. nBUS_03]|uniref:hypothetical protein n=1 Tax=Tenacibaculum sp. nBUS_03 TaxID=3395320 RepID=UPI003EBB5C5E